MMRAIGFDAPGDESVLVMKDVAAPVLSANDVRIDVYATAVNRADLMQRRGLYPPPPGASEILGLECAGVVREVGARVTAWKPGDEVMALLAGGGYAEEVVVDAGSVLPKPASFSWDEAGAFAETFLTVFSNVFMLGDAQAGETLLVHGGGSGIGTSTITLGKHAGLSAIVTAGDAKCGRCMALGARAAINYTREDFAVRVQELTGGRGVDIVLDSIGAKYFDKNIASLATDGRLLLIGLLGGAQVTTSLAPLLGKRLQVIGSTLRGRSTLAKADIVRAFMQRFGDAFLAGELRPVVHVTLPLEQAADAHRLVQASTHFGKVVLRVREGA